MYVLCCYSFPLCLHSYFYFSSALPSVWEQEISTPEVVHCLAQLVCYIYIALHQVYLLHSLFSRLPTMHLIPFTTNTSIFPVVCKLFNHFVQSIHICFLALPLLAQHLSVVWSNKSVSSDHILSAIAFYQESQACTKVMQAVDQVLSNYQGLIPTPDRCTSTFVMLILIHIMPL